MELTSSLRGPEGCSRHMLHIGHLVGHAGNHRFLVDHTSLFAVEGHSLPMHRYKLVYERDTAVPHSPTDRIPETVRIAGHGTDS